MLEREGRLSRGAEVETIAEERERGKLRWRGMVADDTVSLAIIHHVQHNFLLLIVRVGIRIYHGPLRYAILSLFSILSCGLMQLFCIPRVARYAHSYASTHAQGHRHRVRREPMRAQAAGRFAREISRR